MKRVTLRQTFENMAGDYGHWLRLNHKKHGIGPFLSYSMLPGTAAIDIYRIAHYFEGLKLRPLSRLLQFFAITLTGTDINPRAEIGKGFVLFHTVGTTMTGNIGEKVVVAGMLKMGGDGRKKDIGAGPGLPVIGDNIQMAVDVMILGPVRIGDGCRICSRATVLKDIPVNSTVAGTPARVIGPADQNSSMYEREE